MKNNVKIAKQLIKIAKNMLAEVEVDQTQHSIRQIWTWIFQNAYQTFEVFLNKAKLKKQNFRYNEGYSLLNLYDFKHNTFTLQIAMSAQKGISVPQTKSIKIRNFSCSGGQVALIKGELKTDDWLPLWRSCKGVKYDEQNGNLDKNSIKQIEKVMEQVIKQFFK